MRWLGITVGGRALPVLRRIWDSADRSAQVGMIPLDRFRDQDQLPREQNALSGAIDLHVALLSRASGSPPRNAFLRPRRWESTCSNSSVPANRRLYSLAKKLPQLFREPGQSNQQRSFDSNYGLGFPFTCTGRCSSAGLPNTPRGAHNISFTELSELDRGLAQGLEEFRLPSSTFSASG
jgi:hypothetical protein